MRLVSSDRLAGELARDIAGQVRNAPRYRGKNRNPEADNSRSQHNPVNGNRAGFVVCKGRCEFKKFHGIALHRIKLLS
jgi:hypothetical protein